MDLVPFSLRHLRTTRMICPGSSGLALLGAAPRAQRPRNPAETMPLSPQSKQALKKRCSRSLLLGSAYWLGSYGLTVLVMIIYGIRYQVDLAAFTLAGPAALALGILGVSHTAVLFGVSILAFMAMALLPGSRLWCVLWLGVGISWLLFVNYVMSIS